MPDTDQPILIRPFRASDETIIAQLKSRAIVAGELPGEREADVPTISLRVESQNVDALRLYERAGFITTHEWRRYVRAADQPRIDRQ